MSLRPYGAPMLKLSRIERPWLAAFVIGGPFAFFACVIGATYLPTRIALPVMGVLVAAMVARSAYIWILIRRHRQVKRAKVPKGANAR